LGLLRREGKQVRAFVIPSARAEHMQKAVRENVAEGSHLYSDGHMAYRPLEVEYEHRYVDHLLEQYVRGQVHVNGIENFWSLLKRSVKGTYIKPEPKHISRYVDEQVFRFNSRKMLDADRFSMALANVAGCRLTWRNLTGKQPKRS